MRDYLQQWNLLAAHIRDGKSFSGHERNCAFLNLGPQTQWANVSGVSGFDLDDDGRAIGVTDWDQDGDLDLWVTNRTGPRLRYLENKYDSESSSVRIKLADTVGNRDAIGARVELHSANGMPVVSRTLRAGGGFLSQSSKWLHFGIPNGFEISHATIRWPDGSIFAARGIQNGRRYTFTRTLQSIAQTVSPRIARQVAPRDEDALPQKPNDMAKVILTQRPPAPAIQSNASRDGVTLVVLFASWCERCRSELVELSEHVDELARSGITVVALSVDDVATGQTDVVIDDSLRPKLAAKLQFITASAETVKELTELHRTAIYSDQSLPLPTSFLLDQSGRVAVIYKGPVTAASVLADASIARNATTQLADAFPFPGQSGISRFDISAIGFAEAYEEAGDFDMAEQNLVRYLVTTQRAIQAGTASADRETVTQLESTYYRLALLLKRQERHQELKTLIRQSLQRFPNSARLRQLQPKN
ncbi:MAG: ASPIC/UnbV domain-containing protein [Planctomycetales bacterium]|nr:ASPIC/UnbV domain-containing protein [Planctomycetales bacterium]